MNKELLQKVLDKVEKERDSFVMESWADVKRDDCGEPICGTTCCLGGWALVLSGEYRLEVNEEAEDVDFINTETGESIQWHLIEEEAKRILDLTDEETELAVTIKDPWTGLESEEHETLWYVTEEQAIEHVRKLLDS